MKNNYISKKRKFAVSFSSICVLLSAILAWPQQSIVILLFVLGALFVCLFALMAVAVWELIEARN